MEHALRKLDLARRMKQVRRAMQTTKDMGEHIRYMRRMDELRREQEQLNKQEEVTNGNGKFITDVRTGQRVLVRNGTPVIPERKLSTTAFDRHRPVLHPHSPSE